MEWNFYESNMQINQSGAQWSLFADPGSSLLLTLAGLASDRDIERMARRAESAAELPDEGRGSRTPVTVPSRGGLSSGLLGRPCGWMKRPAQ